MKKILIVEDNEINVDLFVQLLEDEYDIEIAFNGVEGVEKAVKHKPDLILMDMALPVMDGWEATRRIKADENLKHIPIVGVSSHAMCGDTEKALAVGCEDYLTKPLDENRLFEILNVYLGG